MFTNFNILVDSNNHFIIYNVLSCCAMSKLNFTIYLIYCFVDYITFIAVIVVIVFIVTSFLSNFEIL